MKIERDGHPGILRAFLLIAWTLLLATLFAQVEIQIEGAHGWAAGLPTWRVTDAPWLRLFFGGRVITGYHVFVFTFMFAVFHLPFMVSVHWSPKAEARVIGSLILFWVLEDALWFILNPAYGLTRLTPHDAPWHPHWLLGVPVDYLVFTLLSAALLWAAYRRPRAAGPEERHEAADPARLGR